MSAKRQMSVRLERWPLQTPFHITGHVFTALEALVVELREGEFVGRGEGAGVYYLKDTVENAHEQIMEAAPEVQRGIDREALQSLLPPGGARNALDCALWDLECKRAGQTVWQRTNITPRQVITCCTIGVLPSPEETGRAASALSSYPLLKIKLDHDRPIERVRAVREARPDVRIMIDANQGFTVPLLEECLPEFAKCGVELVEQPLPRGDDAALKGLKRAIPICADESCLHRGELEQAAQRYDVINIKLDKAGGLTEGLLLADEILARGLDVMVGNMLGTSLAMAPAMVVAHKGRVADLDGPLSLRSDRLHAMQYNNGAVSPFSKELWG